MGVCVRLQGADAGKPVCFFGSSVACLHPASPLVWVIVCGATACARVFFNALTTRNCGSTTMLARVFNTTIHQPDLTSLPPCVSCASTCPRSPSITFTCRPTRMPVLRVCYSAPFGLDLLQVRGLPSLRQPEFLRPLLQRRGEPRRPPRSHPEVPDEPSRHSRRQRRWDKKRFLARASAKLMTSSLRYLSFPTLNHRVLGAG